MFLIPLLLPRDTAYSMIFSIIAASGVAITVPINLMWLLRLLEYVYLYTRVKNFSRFKCPTQNKTRIDNLCMYKIFFCFVGCQTSKHKSNKIAFAICPVIQSRYHKLLQYLPENIRLCYDNLLEKSSYRSKSAHRLKR